MRTPGRCLNYRGCWLGNGRRDIWVSIGDNFCCPVCGETLVVPPMPGNQGSGLAMAVAACVVLAAGAGATGFALRHVFTSAQQTSRPAALHAHLALRGPTAKVAARVVVSRVAEAAIPQQSMQRVAERAAPLAPLTLDLPAYTPRWAAAAPIVPPRAAAPLDASRGDTQVARAESAPVRPAVLPISFGQPVAPEAERREARHAWHHRSAPEPRNEILPAPDAPTDEDTVVSQVAEPFTVAQGDGDEGATAPVTAADEAPVDAPADADNTGDVPVRGVRVMADFAPQQAPVAMPAVMTRMTVPAVSRIAEDAPAERVDAAVAGTLDTARDAGARLATMPPAPPAKLAVPEYPPVAADLEMPGRVNVGCVITVRGEPSDCQVTHRVGAPSFATAVMQWLHSGEVRYRPHLAHGTPVPEAHAYDVKFEP